MAAASSTSQVTLPRVIAAYEAVDDKVAQKEADLWIKGALEVVEPSKEEIFKSCKLAELDDLKFHDIRKTFASTLAQNGVSTAVTQRLLEHPPLILQTKCIQMLILSFANP